jgi:IS30 family transposase
MAAHHACTVASNNPVYFGDPQSPCQRGTNERMNGLLRQYFPKTTDLSRIQQSRLNSVTRVLNNRLRATLDFHSPGEKFNKCCGDRLSPRDFFVHYDGALSGNTPNRVTPS